MRASVRIPLGVLGLLALLVAVAYLAWFRNPYEDRLQLDPRAVFSAPDDLVIRNATLIDVEAGVSRPASLLIEDGRIVSAAPGHLEAPARIRTIDASGKYVLPGLVDVHAHLKMGGIASPEPLTPLVALENLVRYGVTTVLVPGGENGGDERIADLKAKAQANQIVAPVIFATGSLLTIRGSHPLSTLGRSLTDADAATLEAAGITVVAEGQEFEPIIRRKFELGLDGIKIVMESGPSPIFGPNPRISYEMAAEIVAVAKRHGLPVYVHATSPDEFDDAVRAGAAAVIHNMEDQPLREQPWVDQMAQRRIFVAPTLSVLHGFLQLLEPERSGETGLREAASLRSLRSLDNPLVGLFFRRLLGNPDVGRRYFEMSSANLLKLHRAGVPIALGTDAGMPFVIPGYSAHVEMELMSRSGLSSAEVLRAATLGGAELLGASDLGRLTPGSVANLIVLDRNPLEDIRNTRSIHRVVLRGHVIE